MSERRAVPVPNTPGASPMPGTPSMADARLSLGQAKLEDLFPEGEAFRRSLQTYVILLALSAFIAAFGLYQDSVASIIGAMVVAPLGGAILAVAGALVTGRSRWQAISLLQVVLGSLMVIVIAYGVSLAIPDPLTLSPALDARTAPGLLDLGVALTAGAAGAYVAARRTGSDALPGVAIAVSLVPPLGTVGICLELGRLDDAGGAMLLFLTNFSAITVVACIVFIISGAAPSPAQIRARQRLRTGLALAAVTLVVVAIPLAWNTIPLVRGAIRATIGAPLVLAWIGDRELTIVSWSVVGDDVTIDLVGSDPPGDAAALASGLADAFGGPVNLEISYVPRVLDRSSSAP